MSKTIQRFTLGIALSVAAGVSVFAQDANEMARKLQDPLANIKALMTSNQVLFNTGNDDVSYSFQLQPVYAIPFEDEGFNLVLRGIVPVLGIAPEGQRPILGEPLPRGASRTWGISDITLQTFVSPRTDDPWKWGLGPMASLKTRTDELLSGPGWGGGPAGVLVGNLTDDISTAVLAGHLWGEEDGFSTSLLQPIVTYNIPGLSGVALGYNSAIAYNWNASSGNHWTIPIGAGLSKTFALDGGTGLNVGLGAYYNAVRPDGAADWSLKFGVSLIFP